VAALAGCSALPTSEFTSSGNGNEPSGTGAQVDGDSADGIREDARAVGTRVQESVVDLSFGGGKSGGTGWVVDEGYVVTNAHIARQSETFQVESFAGETGTAERVGYYESMSPDVALLETDLTGIPSLPTGDSSAVERGDPLVIVGHPQGVGKWVISLGSFLRYEESIDWLLTDAPTNNGNSGSPLVTLDGEVVGCVSGGTTVGERPEPVIRSERVFEAFPDSETAVTANSVETVEESVAEWR
jgi:S1-C subfamily serine protease